jgi:hypothetical protein
VPAGVTQERVRRALARAWHPSGFEGADLGSGPTATMAADLSLACTLNRKSRSLAKDLALAIANLKAEQSTLNSDLSKRLQALDISAVLNSKGLSEIENDQKISALSPYMDEYSLRLYLAFWGGPVESALGLDLQNSILASLLALFPPTSDREIHPNASAEIIYILKLRDEMMEFRDLAMGRRSQR